LSKQFFNFIEDLIVPFLLICKAVHGQKCIFLVCKIIFSDVLFFDYQRLSLQAVLFLVPKNVSESCITNATCEVECMESFSSSIQINQYQEYQAHVDALG